MFFSKTQNKSESTSVPKQTCSQSAVRGVSTHDARRERSSSGCFTLVVVEERPPPPPPPTHTHMSVKRFGCTAINKSAI